MGNTLIHKPVEEWATIFLDDAANTTGGLFHGTFTNLLKKGGWNFYRWIRRD